MLRPRYSARKLQAAAAKTGNFKPKTQSRQPPFIKGGLYYPLGKGGGAKRRGILGLNFPPLRHRGGAGQTGWRRTLSELRSRARWWAARLDKPTREPAGWR